MIYRPNMILDTLEWLLNTILTLNKQKGLIPKYLLASALKKNGISFSHPLQMPKVGSILLNMKIKAK